MAVELSYNAVRQFETLYSLNGETIEDTFERVAKEFSKTDEDNLKAYHYLENNIWRPNTPTFLNAGTKHKVFSACFPKGTLIRCKDGLVPIEDVEINDEVLTHNGFYKHINNTMIRYNTDDLYDLDVVGIPKGMLCSTSEHPYYVIDKKEKECIRKKNCRCDDGNREYCGKSKNNHSKDYGRDFNPIWKKAKELNVGDYVTISYDDSINTIDVIDLSEYIDKSKYTVTDNEIYYQSTNRINRYIKIDEDLMLLFGYYLAKGSCGKTGGDVRFTFSLYKNKEKEYCDDIKRILTEKFGLKNVKINETERTGTRGVRKENIVMCNFLREFFGDSSLTKKIPKILMNLSPLLQEYLLIGIFRGDGFLSNNRIAIALANFNLIHQIWEILMRCGMFFPMNYQYFSKNTEWGYTQAHRLETPAYYVEEFIKKIWPDSIIDNKNYSQKSYFKVGKYWATKIKHIEKKKFDDIVYNFEVEDDNTYTVMNVNVHNCYVVGLKDSMSSIYDISNISRKIFQYGSGVGIPIGNLREAEACIYEKNKEKPPEGKSSGPITFMKLYDSVGETTKSGGRVRRAAILCSMPVWHPDIMDFIECKEIDGRLSNMNISVSITDEFMQCLRDNVPFKLRTPYDGSVVGEIDPQELWTKLSKMAWKSADPGVLYIDTINQDNPLIEDKLIETCNPCGEQPLLPFSCCNLSAINISKFVKGKDNFDFHELYKVSSDIMELMDNGIDSMDFPDDEKLADDDDFGPFNRFRENTMKYRPVGIGPMGLADAMFLLGYRYDGPEGRNFAGQVMRTITTACVHKSALLAEKHGPFHDYSKHRDNFEKIVHKHMCVDRSDTAANVFEIVKKYGCRNIQFTTAQPTGTTALSCDCSYGIEPSFGLVFQKNYVSGESALVVNPYFEKIYGKEEWFNTNLVDKIRNNEGSLKGLRGIPKEAREIFVTAHDIKYKDRIDMQAELQKYCSTAISSTVNLPKSSTEEEISDLYIYAYEKGLKGVTIYRDGSKKGQPVTFKVEDEDIEFNRPNKLSSKTFSMESGNGRMYITVSDYKNKPLEVFMHIGKSGQILNTFSEALGRVISIALQNGVPVEKVTKTLIGINSDKPTWFRFEPSDNRPTQILSVPDGLAKLLDRYYSGQQYEGEFDGDLCPNCGLGMVASEGCFNCSCGYSKCS